MISRKNQSSAMLSTSLVLVLMSASSILCDPHPWEDNVCNRTVPVKKDIVIEQPVQYEIKVQSMCGLLPCVKTRTETRTDQSIKTILQSVEKATCCPGYTETADRKCAPICLQSCNNGGKCVAPNECRCRPEPSDSSPGFVGPTCARFVCSNDDKWGSKCDRPCGCSGNSYCGADSGKCLCYPGWRGSNCTLECDPFSDSNECQESNRLPPIIEPESNLMSDTLVMMRQKPEALVLDDDVKIVAGETERDWRNLTTNYLIGGLSVISLVFIVAFLVIRRRYQRVRNELYYSASNYPASSSTYSEPPPYDSASQISSSSSSSSSLPPAVKSTGNLEKNFSFAAATRNILLGKDLNSLQEQQQQKGKGHDDSNKTTAFRPRVVSHLIKSQKQARQNIYTDVVLNVHERQHHHANRPQLRTPSPPSYSFSEEHIYQVPKSISPSVGTQANLSDFSSAANDSQLQCRNSSTPDQLEQSRDQDVDDSTMNIYEELQPRK